MGADLYIKKLQAPVRAEWQPKFDAAVRKRDAATTDAEREEANKTVAEAYDKLYGDEHYFRDSYNSSSVLWLLGLSWWRDLKPDVEYVEGDPATEINVSAEACRAFRNRVASATLKTVTRQWLEKNACTVDDGENSPEAWNRHFAEKRDRLIAFLDRAAEHGGMYASC